MVIIHRSDVKDGVPESRKATTQNHHVTESHKVTYNVVARTVRLYGALITRGCQIVRTCGRQVTEGWLEIDKHYSLVGSEDVQVPVSWWGRDIRSRSLTSHSYVPESHTVTFLISNTETIRPSVGSKTKCRYTMR